MFRDQLWQTSGTASKIWPKRIKSLRSRSQNAKELFYVLSVVYFIRINLRMPKHLTLAIRIGNKGGIFTHIGTSGEREK